MADDAEKCGNDFEALSSQLEPIIKKLDESGQKLLLANIKEAVEHPEKVDIKLLSQTLSTHGVSASEAEAALIKAQSFAKACPDTSKDIISLM